MIIVGDPHFSIRPAEAYRWDVAKQILELVRQNRPSPVVILGDLCTEKDGHPAELVTRIVEWIRQLADLAPVHILMGNHDYVRPTCPFFGFLGYLPGVHYHKEPWRCVVEDQECVFLPHSRQFGEYESSPLVKKPFDVLFLHQTFDGARTASGFVMSGGKLKDFPCKHIISGDVHEPQTLGRCVYVGSPYPTVFGEEHQGRVLVGPPWQSVDLKHPVKRTIEYSPGKELVPEGQDLRPGDHLRIKVRLRRPEFQLWPEVREAVVEWARSNRYVLYSLTMVPKKDTTRVRLKEAKPGQSPRKLLDQFCELKGCSSKIRVEGRYIVDQTNHST